MCAIKVCKLSFTACPFHFVAEINLSAISSPSRTRKVLRKSSETIQKAIANSVYEFGPFRLDAAEHQLLREGKAVPLTPKVFDILLVLVQNNGHVLGKDELMKAVWPDSFVEEGNLTRNVSTLRTALGGGPDEQQYIETVPRIGYRFVAGVEKTDEAPDLTVEEHSRSPAAIHREGSSDRDQAEQAFNENGSMVASGFRVLPRELISPADDAAPNQTPPGPADAGSLFSRSRNNWIRVALVSLAAVIIAALVYTLFFRGAPAARQPEIKSLAVLPLKSLSGEANDDYLGFGLADSIITKVSQIGELTVRPTSAVRKYTNQQIDSLAAAQQLKVDSVLDGTVQRAGDRLRVNLNLLRVSDGSSLWSDSFNVSFADIFKMQDEVSQQVAARLRLKLKPMEQARLASARPTNPEAYDYYLRGKYHAGLQIKAEIEAAIELLERAVAIDPSFALAHAELSHEYRTKAFAFKPEEKEWEEKAFVAAEKALLLDPDLAQAHVARGLLLWTHSNHFPHERAIEEYRRALSLNPNLDEAHHQLASVYNHIGLLDKAEEEIQKAVAINPGNTGARFRVGVNLLYQGKYEQALAAMGDSQKFWPPGWGYQTAWALFQLGRKDEAAARIEESLKNYPQDEGGTLTSMEALLAASAGEEQKAGEKIKRAAEIGKGFGHFHHTAYAIASAYALMNKPGPALEWLQIAADDGFPCYPLFERDPNLDHLRQGQHFIAFMTKLKTQWEHYQATL